MLCNNVWLDNIIVRIFEEENPNARQRNPNKQKLYLNQNKTHDGDQINEHNSYINLKQNLSTRGQNTREQYN